MSKQISNSNIKKKTYPAERSKFDFEVSLWVYYVTRPLSFSITNIFLRLNISANFTTVISFIIGIFSCCFFCYGDYSLTIVGAFLYNLFLVMDSVDGNIARYNNQSSKKGTLLDALVGDLINILILPSICLGLILHQNQYELFDFIYIDRTMLLTFVFIAIACNLFTSLFFQRKKIIFSDDTTKANSFFMKRSNLLYYFLFILRNLYGFAFIAPAIIIFSISNFMIILLLLLSLINVGVFLATLTYAIYFIFVEKASQ
ncbi:CDP-alcohol phosphatidyltransferase family protein [Pelagibacteraceae bacterium]|nr:CDP-alcohol phosphatidyltransferase family protein [Pelagibacteraceae bacterium]